MRKNLKTAKITDVSEINTSTIEGRLLLAALATITTLSHTSNTPEEVIAALNNLSKAMFSK